MSMAEESRGNVVDLLTLGMGADELNVATRTGEASGPGGGQWRHP